MKSNEKKVAYLLESIEALKEPSFRKRKILLTLLYWKVFDGIDIPDDVMKSILKQGTNPETISRAYRKVNALLRKREGKNKNDNKYIE